MDAQRASRAGRRRVALARLGLLAALACRGASHEFRLADAYGGAPAQHFALAPLNLVVAMPEELEPAGDRVLRQLRIYLESRGRALSALDPDAARGLWRACVAEVHADPSRAGGFEAVASLFARRATRTVGSEALLLPALVYRPARQRYGHVRWDGVVRSVMGPLANLERMSGASLHVLVYSDRGIRIFEGFGGVDVTHELDAEGGFAVRDDLLADSEHLREGIAIALDPYLPRR